MLDPSLKEAAAAAGALTVVATTHGEVCALHKPGGVGISLSQARPSARAGSGLLRGTCIGSDHRTCIKGLRVRLPACGRQRRKLSELQQLTPSQEVPSHAEAEKLSSTAL